MAYAKVCGVLIIMNSEDQHSPQMWITMKKHRQWNELHEIPFTDKAPNKKHDIPGYTKQDHY